AEQIAQCGERPLCLALARARPENALATRLRALDAPLPDDRLADPGLAVDQQRSRQRPLEETVENGKLLVPADDHGHARREERKRRARRFLGRGQSWFAVGHAFCQLGPRADAELRVDPGEVRLD